MTSVLDMEASQWRKHVLPDANFLGSLIGPFEGNPDHWTSWYNRVHDVFSAYDLAYLLVEAEATPRNALSQESICEQSTAQYIFQVFSHCLDWEMVCHFTRISKKDGLIAWKALCTHFQDDQHEQIANLHSQVAQLAWGNNNLITVEEYINNMDCLLKKLSYLGEEFTDELKIGYLSKGLSGRQAWSDFLAEQKLSKPRSFSEYRNLVLKHSYTGLLTTVDGAEICGATCPDMIAINKSSTTMHYIAVEKCDKEELWKASSQLPECSRNSKAMPCCLEKVFTCLQHSGWHAWFQGEKELLSLVDSALFVTSSMVTIWYYLWFGVRCNFCGFCLNQVSWIWIWDPGGL